MADKTRRELTGIRGPAAVVVLGVTAAAALAAAAGCVEHHGAVVREDPEDGNLLEGCLGVEPGINAPCSGDPEGTSGARGRDEAANSQGCPSHAVVSVQFHEQTPRGSLFLLLPGTYSDRDLYRFGSPWAHVDLNVTGGDEHLLTVAAWIDGTSVFRAGPGQLAAGLGGADADIPLQATHFPEGEHVLTVEVSCGETVIATREEPFRILFNATALVRDPCGLLWVGTFEHGLLAYSTGADLHDPADDAAGPVPLLDPPVSNSPPISLTAQFGETNSALSVAWDPSLNATWAGSFAGGLFLIDPAADCAAAGTLAARFHVPECGGPAYPCGGDRFAGQGDSESSILKDALVQTVTAIEHDGGTGLWVGTLEGLVHFDHGGTPLDPTDDLWTTFPSQGHYDANIAGLAVDAAGRVWIASFDLIEDTELGDGLTVLDPHATPWYKADDEWGRFPDLAQVMPDKLYTVAVDHQNLVWAGTTEGLFVLDYAGTPFDPRDDAWAHRDMNSGLPDNDIGVVAPRSDGTLWVAGLDVCEQGSGGGLALLDLGSIVYGLPPSPESPSPESGGAALTPDEQRAAAALDPALDNVVAVYTTDDGLLDADVSSLVELPGGQVVVGTFNLLGAGAVSMTIAKFAPTDVEMCGGGDAVDVTPGGSSGWDRGSTSVGADGLSIIDQNGTPADKSDDAVVNL